MSGSAFHRFANPGRFLRLASRILPWLAAATALSFAVGLYFALWASPPDYQQKDTVRIMYVHVPAAWIAMFAYGWVGLCSAAALIWRHPLADVAAEAASPIGATFTFIALVSGSLWGRPMWGTYWVWDALPVVERVQERQMAEIEKEQQQEGRQPRVPDPIGAPHRPAPE